MQSLFGKSGRQHILVVDSDREAAWQLSEVIARMVPGHEIMLACSGLEGLQKIEKGVVNIVLAAEKMVDMTGSTFITILQGLKKIKKNETACVLMAQNKNCMKDSDINGSVSFDVISSPVDPEELAHTLSRAKDLKVLNGQIWINVLMGRVLLGMIPVAVGIGMVVSALWSE